MQIRLLLSFNAKVSNKIRSIVTGLGMRKGILAVGAMLMLGASMQANADAIICVFDFLGKSAYAYKALEIEKGLGTTGAMFDNVPVVNITIELIIRPNSFPAGFSLNSREWFIQQIPTSFAMIKRLEDAIPTKYKYSISKEEVENYEKLFREQRIRFTKDGIYDPVMMGVLKRARCSVERTRFECSLGGE